MPQTRQQALNDGLKAKKDRLMDFYCEAIAMGEGPGDAWRSATGRLIDEVLEGRELAEDPPREEGGDL